MHRLDFVKAWEITGRQRGQCETTPPGGERYPVIVDSEIDRRRLGQRLADVEQFSRRDCRLEVLGRIAYDARNHFNLEVSRGQVQVTTR